MTTKQCGNCKFWDRDSSVKNTNLKQASNCLAPVPTSCADIKKLWVFEAEGQDCPAYVERQDAHEGDDDPPDENGYTRSDEDWFFDDKDD